MYLLDYKKNWSELVFQTEIKTLEFVELIGDMDISHCVNYKERDIQLKNIGCKLFKLYKSKINKGEKIKFKINYKIEYISKKQLKNKIKLFFKKLFGLNIDIYINIIKFKNSSSITYNYDYSKEILSQDEIDDLLSRLH